MVFYGPALFNSVANLGGLLGPTIVGQVKTATDSFTLGYLILASALCAGGLLVLSLGNRDRRN